MSWHKLVSLLLRWRGYILQEVGGQLPASLVPDFSDTCFQRVRLCISGRHLTKALHTQAQEGMDIHPALQGRQGVSADVASRQRLQQRLGLLEVGGVKALGEPAIDWGQ